VLVDVAVDEVDGAVDLLEAGERVADAVVDAVPQLRPAQLGLR
jgi:hypothetical protein